MEYLRDSWIFLNVVMPNLMLEGSRPHSALAGNISEIGITTSKLYPGPWVIYLTKKKHCEMSKGVAVCRFFANHHRYSSILKVFSRSKATSLLSLNKTTSVKSSGKKLVSCK